MVRFSGTYPRAEIFFTSGMLRTEETLSILYGNVPHVVIPELSEYRFGDFEMRSHGELYEAEPVYREWLNPENRDVVCPGGESRRIFEERIDIGIQKLLAHPWRGLAVLISHGGVISNIARRVMPGNDHIPPLENGQGYRFFVANSGLIPRYESFP